MIPDLTLLTQGSAASLGQAFNNPAFQTKAKRFFSSVLLYAHFDPGMEAFLFLIG